MDINIYFSLIGIITIGVIALVSSILYLLGLYNDKDIKSELLINKTFDYNNINDQLNLYVLSFFEQRIYLEKIKDPTLTTLSMNDNSKKILYDMSMNVMISLKNTAFYYELLLYFNDTSLTEVIYHKLYVLLSNLLKGYVPNYRKK